jgi:oligosaccharide repeat unit polymerase
MNYIGSMHTFVFSLWIISLISISVWYFLEIQKNRIVTFLSYTILFNFFLSIILQYPFAFSNLNIISTGQEGYEAYLNYIDLAFALSFIGMLFFCLGYFIAPINKGQSKIIGYISSSLRAWTQRINLFISVAFVLIIFILMLKLGLFGIGGAREQAMEKPYLRPIYNLVHTILPLLTAIMLLVGIGKKRKGILFLVPIIVLLGLLTGTRSAAFGGILIYFLVVLTDKSITGTFNFSIFIKYFLLISIFLVLGLFLGEVRNEEYDLIKTVLNIGKLIFYGNNFSDLRDFAWLLAYWDKSYLYGKSELAGFLSFFPSFLFDFRTEWGWGVFSTKLLGFDNSSHPGLRPSVFGEAFFNFGITGVIISGFIYGYVTKFLHYSILNPKLYFRSTFDRKLYIMSIFIAGSLFWNFLMTAGFYSFYLTVIFFFIIQLFHFAAKRLPAKSILTKGPTS